MGDGVASREAPLSVRRDARAQERPVAGLEDRRERGVEEGIGEAGGEVGDGQQGEGCGGPEGGSPGLCEESPGPGGHEGPDGEAVGPREKPAEPGGWRHRSSPSPSPSSTTRTHIPFARP